MSTAAGCAAVTGGGLTRAPHFEAVPYLTYAMLRAGLGLLGFMAQKAKRLTRWA
jgi:hypothetical protein